MTGRRRPSARARSGLIRWTMNTGAEVVPEWVDGNAATLNTSLVSIAPGRNRPANIAAVGAS